MFSLMGFREAGYPASPKTICPLKNLSNTKKATIYIVFYQSVQKM